MEQQEFLNKVRVRVYHFRPSRLRHFDYLIDLVKGTKTIKEFDDEEKNKILIKKEVFPFENSYELLEGYYKQVAEILNSDYKKYFTEYDVSHRIIFEFKTFKVEAYGSLVDAENEISVCDVILNLLKQVFEN